MNELSGYVEIYFKAIDRKLPFKFGVNASALFCRHYGVDLYDIASTGIFGTWEDQNMIKPPDAYAILVMAYYAYVTAQRMKGQSEEFCLEEFLEICNEEEKVIAEFQSVMLSSKILGFRLDGQKEDVKKKAES